MVFQENLSNGSRDTAGTALHSQSSVPFIVERLQKKSYTALGYGQRVQGEKSEVNCWNGRQITNLSMCKKNILYSKSYILLEQYIPYLKFQSLSVL